MINILENVGFKKYGYYIHVYSEKHPNSEIIVNICWKLFSFDTFSKYRWYFEYRYALLRVQYPKNAINHGQLFFDMTNKEKKSKLENQIIAHKRKITEFENKLKLIVENWTELFPIEDNLRYKNTVEKILEKKKALHDLEKIKDQIIVTE